MAISRDPEAVLSHLAKADGSATFSYAGYTIVGAVNGPIEVQRRDEIPEEAALDILVRPAAGVGATRERHLESLIYSTLRQLLLLDSYPRTLIQVILQVTVAPENDYVNPKVSQAGSNLPILPALLHTAVLSLLSAAIPLSATLTATSYAVVDQDDARQIVVNPTARQIEKSISIHVFAFTSRDELILAESEGSFTMDEWNTIHDKALQQCCPAVSGSDGDAVMDDDSREAADMRNFTRSLMQDKIAADLHWK